MKKIITLLAILISSVACFSQTILMNNVASTASGNYSATIPGNVTIGNITITTSAAFNGSTTTAALYSSNDGIYYTPVYQSDNTTAMSFTLTAGANSYVWIIPCTPVQRYQIVYTKGNATLGTVYASMIVH